MPPDADLPRSSELNPRISAAERAAYAAGLRDAADLARIAAITLEVRSDGDALRQRAAVAALYGLAEGIAALAMTASENSGNP